jgi:hypothetical protein
MPHKAAGQVPEAKAIRAYATWGWGQGARGRELGNLGTWELGNLGAWECGSLEPRLSSPSSRGRSCIALHRICTSCIHSNNCT